MCPLQVSGRPSGRRIMPTSLSDRRSRPFTSPQCSALDRHCHVLVAHAPFHLRCLLLASLAAPLAPSLPCAFLYSATICLVFALLGMAPNVLAVMQDFRKFELSCLSHRSHPWKSPTRHINTPVRFARLALRVFSLPAFVALGPVGSRDDSIGRRVSLRPLSRTIVLERPRAPQRFLPIYVRRAGSRAERPADAVRALVRFESVRRAQWRRADRVCRVRGRSGALSSGCRWLRPLGSDSERRPVALRHSAHIRLATSAVLSSQQRGGGWSRSAARRPDGRRRGGAVRAAACKPLGVAGYAADRACGIPLAADDCERSGGRLAGAHALALAAQLQCALRPPPSACVPHGVRARTRARSGRG
jgi:hypothetical protein